MLQYSSAQSLQEVKLETENIPIVLALFCNILERGFCNVIWGFFHFFSSNFVWANRFGQEAFRVFPVLSG